MSFLAKLILAVAVNLLIFISFPILHGILGDDGNKDKDKIVQRKIITEVVKKKEKPKPKPKKKIRKIQSKSRPRSGENMQMKFKPDLAAEGSGSGDGVGMQSDNLETVIFKEGETEVDVVPLKTPSIPYPQRARDKGIEGTLEVLLVIGRTGKVESIKFLQSPGRDFEKAANKILPNWRFQPAQNKGVPVKVYRTKKFVYKLR